MAGMQTSALGAHLLSALGDCADLALAEGRLRGNSCPIRPRILLDRSPRQGKLSGNCRESLRRFCSARLSPSDPPRSWHGRERKSRRDIFGVAGFPSSRLTLVRQLESKVSPQLPTECQKWRIRCGPAQRARKRRPFLVSTTAFKPEDFGAAEKYGKGRRASARDPGDHRRFRCNSGRGSGVRPRRLSLAA